ncbi:hypothetical protein G6L37_07235 [Agrobacterium rubi]|nr:hypothetical protein [Agrobacterium rubi]NTF25160.1 hypothetical protein [Agrobacterium rubi]
MGSDRRRDPLLAEELDGERRQPFHGWMITTLKAVAALSMMLLGASTWGYVASWISGEISFSDMMLWADQTIINTTIVMMLTMIAFRRLELIWVPILIAIGEMIYDNRILISGLHSLLLQIDTYRDLLGRHATRQVNPQYAMVAAYLLSFIALLAVCINRARRSFDRTMVLVMAASIMATFALFHTFMMVGISRQASSEGRAIHAVLVSDEEAFPRLCQTLVLECSRHTRQRLTAGNVSTVDPLALRTLSDLAKQGARLDKPFIWDGATDDDASRTTFFIMGVGSDDEGYRVARSRTNYEAATKFEELRYTTQALMAHAVWMLIAVGLIAIHRRHARPKVKRLFSDESFRT